MSQIISRLLSDRNYAILLTAVFLIVGAISTSHHEMWRDETQAWLLARDSSSVIDLFGNLKYEGHPGLWHLCLMPLSRITRSPVIMQVFHLMIAGAVVYVFSRFSPFAKFQKALFAFGYFPFYEYSVISRNYALGVLLLFTFCALFKRRSKNLPLIGFILFLLAHTSVHCLIITIAIGIGLFAEYFIKSERRMTSLRNPGVYVGFAIIALGIATSIIQLKPPADTGFAVSWVTKYDPTRIRNVFNIMEKAFVPIPRFVLNFWNSNILDKVPASVKVKSIIAGVILLWAVVLLLGKRISLLIYVSGTIGLLTFFYVKYFGSMRHHGFLFMLFLASAWISHYCRDAKRLRLLNRLSSIFRRHLNIPLALILVTHLVGGVAATAMDYRYTFSQAKATAHYIRESKMDGMVMVGDYDHTASTVAGYLGNSIYYVRGDRLGSFVIWDKKRTKNISHDDVLRKAKELADLKKQDVLIILYSALKKEKLSQYSLTEVSKFEKAVVANEVYYLYLMSTTSAIPN
jgi:hypothetical protein